MSVWHSSCPAHPRKPDAAWVNHQFSAQHFASRDVTMLKRITSAPSTSARWYTFNKVCFIPWRWPCVTSIFLERHSEEEARRQNRRQNRNCLYNRIRLNADASFQAQESHNESRKRSTSASCRFAMVWSSNFFQRSRVTSLIISTFMYKHSLCLKA